MPVYEDQTVSDTNTNLIKLMQGKSWFELIQTNHSQSVLFQIQKSFLFLSDQSVFAICLYKVLDYWFFPCFACQLIHQRGQLFASRNNKENIQVKVKGQCLPLSFLPPVFLTVMKPLLSVPSSRIKIVGH